MKCSNAYEYDKKSTVDSIVIQISQGAIVYKYHTSFKWVSKYERSDLRGSQVFQNEFRDHRTMPKCHTTIDKSHSDYSHLCYSSIV